MKENPSGARLFIHTNWCKELQMRGHNSQNIIPILAPTLFSFPKHQLWSSAEEGIIYDCLILFSTFVFLFFMLIGEKQEMGAMGDSFCFSNTKAAKGKCP